MIRTIKKYYEKYIDIQYKILLRIFLYLFPKETPQTTDEKISKIKAGSKFLLKKCEFLEIYSLIIN